MAADDAAAGGAAQSAPFFRFPGFADTPELVGWILSFRSGVRVVRPENLGDRVREEARKILRG